MLIRSVFSSGAYAKLTEKEAAHRDGARLETRGDSAEASESYREEARGREGTVFTEWYRRRFTDDGYVDRNHQPPAKETKSGKREA